MKKEISRKRSFISFFLFITIVPFAYFICGKYGRSVNEVNKKDAVSRISDESIASVIVGSDNYKRYSQIFLKAARELYEKGICSLDDLKNHGGFVRSTKKTPRKETVYFVYCGDTSNVSGRYYIAINPRKKTFRHFK